MSDQTLWELAQSWEHKHDYFPDPQRPFSDVKAHEKVLCHRCQLEKLLREKAGQWIQNAQDHGQRNQRENELAWAITEAHVADLGVSREEQ